MPYTHRPLFSLSIAFAVGIWLSTSMPIPVGWTLGAIVLFCAVCMILRGRWSACGLCFLFAACGALHAAGVQLVAPNNIAVLSYKERRQIVSVEGVIISDIDGRDTLRGAKTSFVLAIQRVDGRSRSGQAFVNIFRRENLRYGQRIVVEGRFHKPFGGSTLGHFSYEDYLKRNGIYWILSVRKDASVAIVADRQGSPLKAAAFRFRHRCKEILERYLNDLESGIIQSLVLGGKYHIPDVVRQVLVETGTAHILAISGMNIGAVALLIVIVLNTLRTGRRLQLLLTIVVLAAYALMTGANASVVRATIMAIIFLAGFLVEREQDTLNSLGLAGLAILVWDPLSLMDIGFQLSFAGVFSIVYFYPIVFALMPLGRIRARSRWMTVALQALCLSLAAWIGVAPLIAYYFQLVTPVTVLANLPIIPFVSALMMLGIGLIAVGFSFPWLAAAFAACIKVVLVLMMMIIESFTHVPFGSWAVKDMTIAGVALYYAAVLSISWLLSHRLRGHFAHDHAQFLS